jgi:hypothetical protein
MASTLHAALGAAVALLAWTGLGLVLTRRLLAAPLALAFAPVIGWAVHNALALPAFFLLSLSAANVGIVFALVALAAVVAVRASAPQDDPPFADKAMTGVPALAYALAALLALVPAAAVLPHASGDGVALAAPIFDHAKVAMIDDMAKFGVPAGNPFFAGPRLVYYYLWHFSAAELAVATGITGWEADAALTWFSGAASLSAMLGLAAWWGGRAAAIVAVVLSATASARPVLWWIFGAAAFDGVIGRAAGFAGWLFQVAFAPQHIMGAACVCASVVLMARLAARPGTLPAAALALVAAAGVECSTWIGGIAFAAAAPGVAAVLLIGADPKQRRRFLAALAAAAVLAVALALPLLRDQIAASMERGGSSPVALAFYPVLGDEVSARLRAVLDPPAFWLVLLPLEMPAVFAAGIAGLVALAKARDLAPGMRRGVFAFAALATACLLVSWLLASTLGDNNDLAWRALLPAVMVLTAAAAAALARWFASCAHAAATVTVVAAVLGVPGAVTLIGGDIAPSPRPGVQTFAESPALWAAVRRHAAPDERIGNNPRFLADLTLWPINISWALLADRRSCFAGRELAIISPSLPPQRRDDIDAQFVRVFAGNAGPGDIKALAQSYDCRVIAVTASDGAWSRDPFAASPLYRLVEETGRWRIYRATDAR